MSPNGYQVEVLKPNGATEAGEQLAASHAEYPAFRAVVPDQEKRRRFLRSFMTTAARDAAKFSEPLIARDDEGLLGGWCGMPLCRSAARRAARKDARRRRTRGGAPRRRTQRAVMTGRRDVGHVFHTSLLGVALWMKPGSFPQSTLRKAAMTPGLLRVAMILGSKFPSFARMGAALERTHPGDRSWYLQAMGVHPRAQRRGVGKALIEPVLVIADEEGLPVHLHTSDPANIAYYQRYDFRVTDPSISVFSNGPTYTAMTRRPL
ncbi:MAG: GNAT family N-acetyltransferase [Acidimicrobiia bacterium]|nr:GNAT family N-acetyltransferase [Acidimicrobiia bacterium]